MSRSVKIAVAVIVVLVAVLGGTAYLVFSSLDQIVKAAIEEVGSSVTKTPVRVGQVGIKPADGKGAINSLVVGNPDGFETDSAVEITTISVAVDMQTIGSDLIRIRDILIEGPSLTYELGPHGSNFDVIRSAVEREAGGDSGDASAVSGASGGAQDGDAEAGPNLVVDRLAIRGGRIAVSGTGLGGRKLSAVLPDIVITGLGSDRDGGITADELVVTVVTRVESEARKSVVALPDLKGLLSGQTDLESAIKHTEEFLKDAGEDTGGALQGLEGTLKNLLNQ